jgi:HAD superfamily hydrolase (TIGR01490 family)
MEAAFFDLDKTVIAKASMVAFSRPLFSAGLLNRWLVLRALYAQLIYQYLGADEGRMAKMREAALKVTIGWEQERIRTIVRETLEEVIEPIIYEEALDLIHRHRDEGRLVYLVSASPEEVVLPLAEFLGADGAIATRAAVDEQGRYSGDLDFYSYGPFKVDAMEELAEVHGIELARSYAYSDSATDIPMLEAVGHPVVVNPDRALQRYADEQGWEVRTFEHPVRLRDRMPVPTTGQAAAGAGLVAAVAGGVAALFWWRARERSRLARLGGRASWLSRPGAASSRRGRRGR